MDDGKINDIYKDRWAVSENSDEFIQKIKSGQNELVEPNDRKKYSEITKKNDGFRIANIYNVKIKQIKKEAYAKIMQDLSEENLKLGITTSVYKKVGRFFFNTHLNKIYS